MQDALDRAKRFDVQVQTAISDAAAAREDRAQAKSSLLPSIINTTQYLGTQGNGVLPTGRYVTNDGVHVYREQGIAHQDINANTFVKTNIRRADAAQALALAKIEIAQRGLGVTVTKNYYALVTSQRRYVTAQQALQTAQRFLDVTQRQENAGQAAHADVVKAQIQYEQQRAGFQEAMLVMENARINLAVLLFPGLNENFTVVDDLDSPRNLPPFSDVQTMAQRQNPDLRVAEATLREADLDIRIAREAYLPRWRSTRTMASKQMHSPCTAPLPPIRRRDCCRISVISSRLILTCRSGIGAIRTSKVRQAQTRQELGPNSADPGSAADRRESVCVL